MSHFYADYGRAKQEGERKICLATTAYAYTEPAYTFAMSKSREALHKRGIITAYYLLQGNCHVDDARNSIVREFLNSDCDELIFIDADSGWEPKDLVRLCKYDEDIVGGVVPYRRDNKEAMPVRMTPGVNGPDERGLMQVDGLGTAFMRIQRRVLEKLFNEADQHNTENSNGVKTAIIFERTFVNGVRFGGDLSFCNKAREAGFKCFADFEMVLSHAGKSIFRSSLGQTLRRVNNDTIAHVSKVLGEGKESIDTIEELHTAIGTSFSMDVNGLTTLMLMARRADGPIIETGSGLSTLIMAAANPKQIVYCIENDQGYAKKLRQWAKAAGLTNIGLCVCPVKDGWYDLEGMDLPERFALGVNDGPPRNEGMREGFYEKFGDCVDIIYADDTSDPRVKGWLSDWADANGRSVDFLGRGAIMKQKEAVHG